MNRNERIVIIAILAIVTLMVVLDLLTDSTEGVPIWHVLVEGGAGFAALFGIFYFMKGSYNLQHKLSDSLTENIKLKQEADDWKTEAQKYIEGLSKSNHQLLV